MLFDSTLRRDLAPTFGATLVVLLTIVSRLLHFHVPGTDAYAGYLMAGSGFLALAHTLKRGEHIRVTLLLASLQGRARHRLELWALTAATALAVLFAVFSAALGGDSSFKQVFAVMAYSSAVTVVQQIFVTPLNYVRESMSSATNLAVFLPMLEESSFLAKFLGMVDLFLIWWVVVLSIGLGVLYKRKTGPIMIGLFAVYAIIAVAVAALFGRGGA